MVEAINWAAAAAAVAFGGALLGSFPAHHVSLKQKLLALTLTIIIRLCNMLYNYSRTGHSTFLFLPMILLPCAMASFAVTVALVHWSDGKERAAQRTQEGDLAMEAKHGWWSLSLLRTAHLRRVRLVVGKKKNTRNGKRITMLSMPPPPHPPAPRQPSSQAQSCDPTFRKVLWMSSGS